MSPHGLEGMSLVLQRLVYRLHRVGDRTQIENESGFLFDMPEMAYVS